MVYIRVKEKPIIGIYNIKAISNLKDTILEIRNKAREFEIGELFITIFRQIIRLPKKNFFQTKKF